jgi:PAS domain S-box-containing protein
VASSNGDSDSDSKRRLEGIVASAMDAIITVDEQLRIVLFNPAAERMFGVASAEALGQPVTRFIPARFHDIHDEHIRRFRDAGVTNRRMGALGAVSGLRANGEEFPVEASISQVQVGGERLATVILRDITERKLNEETRVLLAREVDHRAKNALAVAQSLVKLTTAATKEDYVKAVQGRISALARAHSSLSKMSWQGADLAQAIGEELSAYAKPGQAQISGPAVTLVANAVQPVSLVIHELATNAFKHGALRDGHGLVRVRWQVTASGALELEWLESGGPAVAPPTVFGFGSTLLREVITRQLEGPFDVEWRLDGVRIRLGLASSMYRLGREAPELRETSRASLEDLIVAPRSANLRRVLVVEDESLIALELAAELSDAGWEVVGPALSLREGLNLAQDDRPLSAAVLDVNLAGRAVYPLAEVLRTRRVPFVFCTGYEMMDAEGRFQDAPVLRKPVNIDLLDRELSGLVRRQVAAA